MNVTGWKTLRFWGNCCCCNDLIVMVKLHTKNENNQSRSTSNNMSLEVESSLRLPRVVTQLKKTAQFFAKYTVVSGPINPGWDCLRANHMWTSSKTDNLICLF